MQQPIIKGSLSEESKGSQGLRDNPSSGSEAESYIRSDAEESSLTNTPLKNCGHAACPNTGVVGCSCSPDIGYCMGHYGQHESESSEALHSKLICATSPVPEILNSAPYRRESSSSSEKSSSNQLCIEDSPSLSPSHDSHYSPEHVIPSICNLPYRKSHTQSVSQIALLKASHYTPTESQDMPRQCLSDIPEDVNSQLRNFPFNFSEGIIIHEEPVSDSVEEAISKEKLDCDCEEVLLKPAEINRFHQLLKQYNLADINVLKSPWKSSFLSKLCSCDFEDTEIPPECDQILRRFISFGAVPFNNRDDFHSDLLKSAIKIFQVDEYSMDKPIPGLTGHKRIQISLSNVLKVSSSTLTLFLISFLECYYKREFMKLLSISEQKRCPQPFLCILIQITQCYLNSLSKRYFHILFSSTTHSVEVCFALYAGLVFKWFELYCKGDSDSRVIISALAKECEQLPGNLNHLSIEKHRLANN